MNMEQCHNNSVSHWWQ